MLPVIKVADIPLDARPIARRSANMVDESYVGGLWLPHDRAGALALDDPSTGQPRVGLIPADRAVLDRAAVAARRAFDSGWRGASVADRVAVLQALSDAIARQSDAFATAISAEMGAPIDYARAEHVKRSIGLIASVIDALQTTKTEQSPAGSRHDHHVLWEPCGVAALITPWNWPLNQIVVKVAAALAAGCTILLKPSEITPVTSRLFAQCASEAESVPGLLNVLLGGAELGQALVEHDAVDVVSFTGSTHVGRQVGAAAGMALRPAILELGGKSASVVFADCDLQQAVGGTVISCMRNSGQACNATSRLLVERRLYGDAVELARSHAGRLTLGSAHLPGPHLGPVATQRQQRAILDRIAVARAEGARLIYGGARVPQWGFFVAPTVLADVAPHSSIFHQEVFGPVLAVTPFDNEAEAIQLANHGPYGLAAQVWSEDIGRVEDIARALDVGMVHVNGTKRHAQAPFAGRKASGYGCEAGLWGIRAFQRTKTVSGSVRS